MNLCKHGMTPANILLIGSVLLLVSIIAAKPLVVLCAYSHTVSYRVGMLARSEGIGGIYFYDPHIAELIGITALNFILFSGGLDTDWRSLRPILWRGIALSTIGVFVTALAVGLSFCIRT